MTTKYRIAKSIGLHQCYVENPTYKQLLEAIYENEYRALTKVPITTFFKGIVDSFVTRDLEHKNKILNIVKEVVQEALEISGIELTFVDEDWFNLKLSSLPYKNWPDRFSEELTVDGITKYTSKSCLGEFFEN